ncbi:MAG: hypothetical protein HKN26_03310, partial [Acidimicrobiales bacterium]|nr:hypothetical protein [Acidimicrobiales bacterium]
MTNNRTWIRILVLLFAFALVAAGCGSDDDDDNGGATTTVATGGTDGGGGGDGLAAAQAAVDANATPPTDIGPTVPLDSVPETKTVAWLECELPSCLDITPGFEAATDALGWELLPISVQSFDPAPGFQQAIDAGVDYVALTGTPAALVQDQIDAAAAAGIGFMSCFSTDAPGGEANNIWIQCGDGDSTFATGNLIAQWAIADSGGAANTLMVNIRDFPVLVSEEEGAKAAYDANCPDCSFEVLNVTLDQFVGGEVPAAVASQLQSNPDINYIHFSFADIPLGVA